MQATVNPIISTMMLLLAKRIMGFAKLSRGDPNRF